ncbi:MAG: hypothetical protein KatS3mg115_1061 [Candidatus Poribacteria bacterium]|nr:MAG: hypothetical protein KatS3mg115_1061 [Candidatus Poribacteria bacterium]
MAQVHLAFFVSRFSRHTPRRIEALQEALSQLDEEVRLDVFYIEDRPPLAEQERVYVTPTLLRLAPAPRERVVGWLEDVWATLEALRLRKKESPLVSPSSSPEGPHNGFRAD